MEFEEIINKFKKSIQKSDEYDHSLSLKKVKDLLVGICNLLLDDDEYNQKQGFFLLGSLVTKMQNILENQEDDDE